MKNLQVLPILVAFGMVFTSCEKEQTEIQEQVEATSATTQEISPKLINKLKNFDVNTNDIKVVDFLLPDGSTQKMYQVEGDIHLSEDEIMNLNSLKGLSAKNYHTNNLVRRGTRINIIGYTGGRNALSRKEQQGLRRAVQNYNQLGLSISFNLTFGTNYRDKDMVVYHNPNQNGSGGSAGFPKNGKPHKYVQIYGLNRYSTNVVEHVITHEIGHSVGFRHTDWQTRRSCGQNQNEGTAGVGANPIPGTPAGYDPTSIMLACFNSGVSGNFNRNDVTALRYLYRR